VKLESNLSVPFLAGVTMATIERHWILKALAYYSGNKTQTASALGISVRTIDNKLKEYEQEELDHADRAANDRADKSRELERQRGTLITQYNGLGSANQINPIMAGAPKSASPPVQNGLEAIRGSRVESAAQTVAEPALPVSKRQEVQSVLPKQSSSGGHGKRG
jgi:hypothetical protein